MIQMASGIGPLLLLGTTAALLAIAGWAGVRFVRRRSAYALLRALAVVVAGYALVLVAGGLFSHDRRISLGTMLCFDDWCATVTGVRALPGPTMGRKTVVASLIVSSAARRRIQRGSDPRVDVIDDAGVWYHADRIAGAFADLRAPVGPGESFRTDVSTVVPTRASIAAVRVWEGAWIDDIIPFDEESPFHGKTFYVVERRTPAQR